VFFSILYFVVTVFLYDVLILYAAGLGFLASYG